MHALTMARAAEFPGGFELDEEFQPVPLGRLGADRSLRGRGSGRQPRRGTGVVPDPPCDCSPGTAHGSIADVAHYLEVDQLWSAGYRGTGMVVGIVDGGITAAGRPAQSGETSNRIPRVIGGYPSDWGTTAKAWGDHGNTCASPTRRRPRA